MSDVRERLESHRKDVLILLQEASRTAELYEGVSLADAVSHLARAQALLAEELKDVRKCATLHQPAHGEWADLSDPLEVAVDVNDAKPWCRAMQAMRRSGIGVRCHIPWW